MVHQLVTEEIPVQKQIPLKVGLEVLITSEPYLGKRGYIVELPNLPVLLENGLRVMVARVEVNLQIVDIPLANLELAGI